MSEAPVRLPPYSEEAERALVGSAIVDFDRVYGLCMARGITKESFYTPALRTIWEQMGVMRDKGVMVDIALLCDHLKTLDMLEQVGGDPHIEGLLDATPTSANAEYYAAVVIEKHKIRRVIDALREGLDNAWAGDESDSLISKVSNALHDLSAEQFQKARSNVEVFDELLKRWELANERRRNAEDVPLPGLETPFGRLNELLSGYQPGLHIIGAPPSTGKTSIEGQICEYIAMVEGPILRIYLDDTHEDAIARSASRMGGVSLPKLQHGFADRGDLQKIREDVRPLIERARYFIVEDCESVEEVCTLARLFKAKHGIVMLTVDYAQIVESEDEERHTQERERLLLVCKKLKRLWKQLRIPILLLSQVQRDHYKVDSDGRKASMADLFGGAGLDQTATSIMIMKKLSEDDIPAQPIDEDKHAYKIPVAAHLVKNKHGPQGLVPLWFYPKYFRFESTPTFMKGNVKEYMLWEQQIEEEQKARDARARK